MQPTNLKAKTLRGFEGDPLVTMQMQSALVQWSRLTTTCTCSKSIQQLLFTFLTTDFATDSSLIADGRFRASLLNTAMHRV